MTLSPLNPSLFALTPDAELVDHIRKRDQFAEEAFKEIYRRHEPFVRSKFALLIGDWSAAEDLTQILLTKLWFSLPRLSIKGNLRTYLAGWANNWAINYSKSSRNKKSLPLYLEDEDGDVYEAPYLPETEGIEDEVIASSLLVEALTNLSDLERQCYLLYTLEGYDQETISKMVNISKKHVSKHVCNAREHISAYLYLGKDTESRSQKMRLKEKGGIPSEKS